MFSMRPIVAFALLALAVPCAAQYPARTVTIIVPVPPGSSTDIVARLLAERLAPRLGQSFVVENRPGASGLVGAGVVARSAPDGHTLAVVASTLFIAPHVMPKGAGGGLDVVKDFSPIVRTASSPMVLIVNPQLGVKSVAELIVQLKRSPGMGYATSGNGSPMHIAGELFKKAVGVDMAHIPYKGVMPAVQDTISGQVKIAFSAYGGIGQFIVAGRIVPLAVVGRPSALLPNLATLAELGIAGIDVGAPWFPLLAPAGTPPAIIARLNQEANAILQLAEVRERLMAAGVEPHGGTPEEAAREIREDFARYGRIVAEFGIKGE